MPTQEEREAAIAAILARMKPARKEPAPVRWAEPVFEPGPDPYAGLVVPPAPEEELDQGNRAYREDFAAWELDDGTDRPPGVGAVPAEFADLPNLPEGCWLPEGLFESKAHADYFAERLETLVAGAEPAVLLAMLAGSGTGGLGYQETVEHLAAVHRVRCWLDGREVALEARLGETALAQLPPPGPGCTTLRQRQLLAATSAAEELGCLLGLPEEQARARLDQAGDLHRLFPATLAAMAAGELDREQAAVIVVQGRSLPEEATAGFEQALLGRVKGRSLRSLRGMARRLRERTHPESITRRRRSAEERRNVGVEPAPDGMAWLNAYLPAEQAAAIDDRLTRTAVHLRGQHGETRSRGQLRADVFADLLMHAGMDTGPAAGIHAEPSVTVPVLSLLGLGGEPATLDGYGPIPADAARQLCADAKSFYRILTHPETGARLSYGKSRYRPPADLARMVRKRDEVCPFAGCRKHGKACQIDHTQAFRADGATGETDAGNLGPPCETHHGLKTNAGWKMAQPSPGVFEVTTPAGRTYTDRPGEDVAPSGRPAYPPAVAVALPEDQRRQIEPLVIQPPTGPGPGEATDDDWLPAWHPARKARAAGDRQQDAPSPNQLQDPPPF
ncbi:HNH endonuclease signature motif containing protein [Arthrobacter sulfonylureivorans]|nr:HNH endonuclease signature motif containing protein [Arthrobacter sulfonylureivorans]